MSENEAKVAANRTIGNEPKDGEGRATQEQLPRTSTKLSAASGTRCEFMTSFMRFPGSLVLVQIVFLISPRAGSLSDSGCANAETRMWVRFSALICQICSIPSSFDRKIYLSPACLLAADAFPGTGGAQGTCLVSSLLVTLYAVIQHAL